MSEPSSIPWQFESRVLAIFAAVAFLFGANLAEARSRSPVRAFIAAVPCPGTGKTHARCPGYVVDHIVPLCAGGADSPDNMQWQERAESLEKDRAEVALCRWLRKAKP